MRTFNTISCFTLGTAVLLTAAAGCNRPSTNMSSVAGTVAGRQIAAFIYYPEGFYPMFNSANIKAGDKVGAVAGPLAFISSDNNSGGISFGNHEIRVERESVWVDGTERARVSAAALHVELVLSNATLTVTAEKTNILTVRIEK